MVEVRRGDIFIADLRLVPEGGIRGSRPVLVIQNDIANKYAPTVIVAPITSFKNKTILPTHIMLDKGHSGINVDSVILLEKVLTIDKTSLREKIGHINDNIMQQVSRAWMLIGGIETETNEQIILDKYIRYYRYRLNEKIHLNEDYQCEFKEIKGLSFKNAINSTISEYVASFLNSSGGSIYYGISDDGIIKGVNLDRHDIDEVNKLIYNNVANICPSISPDYFQIDYHPVYNEEDKIIDNLYVVQITVPLSPVKQNIYFIRGTEIFIRVKGVKKKLQGTEIVTYIQKRLLDEEFKEFEEKSK